MEEIKILIQKLEKQKHWAYFLIQVRQDFLVKKEVNIDQR